MAIPGISTVVQNIGSGANQIAGQISGTVGQVTGAISSVTGAVGQVTGAIGQIGGSVTGAIGTITGAISGGINSVSSALRGANLPNVGGTNAATAASAFFGASDVNNDWRVRLSIPPIDGFKDSPVLAPLKKLGGLVFPYTPTIQLSHTANYNELGITHQNYHYMAYESSRVDQIVITAPFNVEDGQQALYWIAALHYLRSVTKMFTGNDTDVAGNPPPIVKLNGYGEYVFNNIPVVVKSFSFDLPQDADYIPADANLLAGIPGLGAFLGAGVKASRVPTKSTLSVVVQPIYPRSATRIFSLKSFVKGEYVSTGGYV